MFPPFWGAPQNDHFVWGWPFRHSGVHPRMTRGLCWTIPFGGGWPFRHSGVHPRMTVPFGLGVAFPPFWGAPQNDKRALLDHSVWGGVAFPPFWGAPQNDHSVWGGWPFRHSGVHPRMTRGLCWTGEGLLWNPGALLDQRLPEALPRGTASGEASTGRCLEALPRERFPEALPRGTASGAPPRGYASRHCLRSAFPRHCLEALPGERFPEALPRGIASGAPSREGVSGRVDLPPFWGAPQDWGPYHSGTIPPFPQGGCLLDHSAILGCTPE